MATRTVSSSRFLARNMGTCLRFNGSGNRVTGTGNTGLDLTNNITIAAWVYLIQYGATSQESCIFSKGEQGSPSNVDYEMEFENNTELRFFSQGNQAITTTYRMPLRQWVHVALNYSSGTVRFFKNGVFIDQKTIANSTLPNQSSNWAIGVRKNAGTYNVPTNGCIDDVRVYNVVLTDVEISNLYYNGSISRDTNLAGLWKFDEGSGTSATDSSGNGNTGSINGATYSTNVKFKSRNIVGTRSVAVGRGLVASVFFLILESGSYILRENSFKLLNG